MHGPTNIKNNNKCYLLLMVQVVGSNSVYAKFQFTPQKQTPCAL